jgi:hypothetical protein
VDHRRIPEVLCLFAESCVVARELWSRPARDAPHADGRLSTDQMAKK